MAAEIGQDRIRSLLGDDVSQPRHIERLDIGDIGDFRVGHDGRGIGIDQDDRVAKLSQGLAGLGAGIVEFAGLADHDRTGSNDQDLVDIASLGHGDGLHWQSACASMQLLGFSGNPIHNNIEQASRKYNLQPGIFRKRHLTFSTIHFLDLQGHVGPFAGQKHCCRSGKNRTECGHQHQHVHAPGIGQRTHQQREK